MACDLTVLLLYGISPSGKTEYFKRNNPVHEIAHASNLSQLRGLISSSGNVDEPLLINVWFDLDCLTIKDMIDQDVTLEAHYLSVQGTPKIVSDKNFGHLFGLRNENVISNKKMFLRQTSHHISNHNWIEILGTRYRMMRNVFPDLIGDMKI